MSDKIKLTAHKREITGKKVKRLRGEGFVPANIYGKNIDSVSVQITLDDFKKAFKAAGETHVIDLTVAGEEKIRPVMISKIQISPLGKKLLHVDLRQVNLSEKISAEVPVEFVGQSPAESAGGVLIKVKDVLTVEALPSDIPDKFEIDLSTIKNIGETLTVESIKGSKKYTITDADDTIIVKVEAKAQAKAESESEEVSEEKEVDKKE